ncbi:MAG TPA: hypothetical protein VKV32_18465, partial [Stellaceae bacterium]|nr:hypothetical protein [Stellaceae bacterium]
MTSAPLTRTLLEAIEPVADRAWLRPAGLLNGTAAEQARAHGLALPLAGGATAFTMVEVLARREDTVLAALAALPRLRAWTSRLDNGSTRERIEAQLAQASER